MTEIFSTYKSVDPIKTAVVPSLANLWKDNFLSVAAAPSTVTVETSPTTSTETVSTTVSTPAATVQSSSSPISDITTTTSKSSFTPTNATLQLKMELAADYVNSHKLSHSIHMCGKYVSNGLSEGANLKIKRRNGWEQDLTALEIGLHSAKKYTQEEIKGSQDTYPKGAMAITKTKGGKWGHVAINTKDGATINDQTWVSDFASRAAPYSKGINSLEIFIAKKGGKIQPKDKLKMIKKGLWGMFFDRLAGYLPNATRIISTKGPRIMAPLYETKLAQLLSEDLLTRMNAPVVNKIVQPVILEVKPIASTITSELSSAAPKVESAVSSVAGATLDNSSTWKISDGMFKNLLKMEGSQNMSAKVHGKDFGETFVTGPYGMTLKHIDEHGNLLSKPIKFSNGETVTPEFAEANARAYYDKLIKEWLNLLAGKLGVTQHKIDALVSASGGTIRSKKALQQFVLLNWGNDLAIADKLRHFATSAAGNGKVMPGLVRRRKFESDWFLGGTNDYSTYKALKGGKLKDIRKGQFGMVLNKTFNSVFPRLSLRLINPETTMFSNTLPYFATAFGASIPIVGLISLYNKLTLPTQIVQQVVLAAPTTTTNTSTTTNMYSNTTSNNSNNFTANQDIVKKAVDASKLGYYMDPSFTKKRSLGNNSYKGLCTSGPATFYHAAGIKLNGHWWKDANGKGVTANGHPVGTNIDKVGFVKVGEATDVEARNNSVNVQPGDIGLLFADNGHVHAEMWNGENWVSDTVQNNGWCYGKNKGRMEIWRYKGNENSKA